MKCDGRRYALTAVANNLAGRSKKKEKAQATKPTHTPQQHDRPTISGGSCDKGTVGLRAPSSILNPVSARPFGADSQGLQARSQSTDQSFQASSITPLIASQDDILSVDMSFNSSDASSRSSVGEWECHGCGYKNRHPKECAVCGVKRDPTKSLDRSAKISLLNVPQQKPVSASGSGAGGGATRERLKQPPEDRALHDSSKSEPNDQNKLQYRQDKDINSSTFTSDGRGNCIESALTFSHVLTVTGIDPIKDSSKRIISEFGNSLESIRDFVSSSDDSVTKMFEQFAVGVIDVDRLLDFRLWFKSQYLSAKEDYKPQLTREVWLAFRESLGSSRSSASTFTKKPAPTAVATDDVTCVGTMDTNRKVDPQEAAKSSQSALQPIQTSTFVSSAVVDVPYASHGLGKGGEDDTVMGSVSGSSLSMTSSQERRLKDSVSEKESCVESKAAKGDDVPNCSMKEALVRGTTLPSVSTTKCLVDANQTKSALLVPPIDDIGAPNNSRATDSGGGGACYGFSQLGGSLLDVVTDERDRRLPIDAPPEEQPTTKRLRLTSDSNSVKDMVAERKQIAVDSPIGPVVKPTTDGDVIANNAKLSNSLRQPKPFENDSQAGKKVPTDIAVSINGASAIGVESVSSLSSSREKDHVSALRMRGGGFALVKALKKLLFRIDDGRNKDDDDLTVKTGIRTLIEEMESMIDDANGLFHRCGMLKELLWERGDFVRKSLLAPLINALLQIVEKHSDDEKVTNAALDAIEAVCSKKKSIPVLLEALQQSSDNSAIQIAGFVVLCRLSEGDDSRVTVELAGDVQLVVQCMNHHLQNVELQIQGCRLLSKLSHDVGSFKAMISANVLVSLLSTIPEHRTNSQVSRSAVQAISSVANVDLSFDDSFVGLLVYWISGNSHDTGNDGFLLLIELAGFDQAKQCLLACVAIGWMQLYKNSNEAQQNSLNWLLELPRDNGSVDSWIVEMGVIPFLLGTIKSWNSNDCVLVSGYLLLAQLAKDKKGRGAIRMVPKCLAIIVAGLQHHGNDKDLVCLRGRFLLCRLALSRVSVSFFHTIVDWIQASSPTTSSLYEFSTLVELIRAEQCDNCRMVTCVILGCMQLQESNSLIQKRGIMALAKCFNNSTDMWIMICAFWDGCFAAHLVAIMEQYPCDAKFQEDICLLFANLSSSEDAAFCDAIVAANGIPTVLAAMKQYPCEVCLQEKGLKLLGRLAYVSEEFCDGIVAANCIRTTVAAMRKHLDHRKVQYQGCRALLMLLLNGNLSDFMNQQRMPSANVLSALVNAMKRHESNEDVQWSGCRAFWEVVSRIRSREYRYQIRDLYVLQRAKSNFPNHRYIPNHVNSIFRRLKFTEQ